MTVTKCAKLRRDFSAAFQAAKKMGVGKMRYIEIAYVVTQDLVKTKKVIIGKIEGTEKVGLVDLAKKGWEGGRTNALQQAWKPLKPQHPTVEGRTHNT